MVTSSAWHVEDRHGRARYAPVGHGPAWSGPAWCGMGGARVGETASPRPHDISVLTPEYIPTEMLLDVLTQAGRLVGIADFRPTFGRFAIVGYEVMGT